MRLDASAKRHKPAEYLTNTVNRRVMELGSDFARRSARTPATLPKGPVENWEHYAPTVQKTPPRTPESSPPPPRAPPAAPPPGAPQTMVLKTPTPPVRF